MAISTLEIVFMVLLAIGVGIAIWWYIVADNYRKYLGGITYARGANGEDGDTINLVCDSDREICVYRATQTCTDPNSNNFENSSTDPISNGTDDSVEYGQFNPNTTVDLISDMGNECNGKQKCSYEFSADWSQSPLGCAGISQIISSYTCIPKGGKCQAQS